MAKQKSSEEARKRKVQQEEQDGDGGCHDGKDDGAISSCKDNGLRQRLQHAQKALDGLKERAVEGSEGKAAGDLKGAATCRHRIRWWSR